MFGWIKRLFPRETVWPEPRCDVCGVHTEEAEVWCGNCGNCLDHCEKYEGCMVECDRCGQWIDPSIGCLDCRGYVVRVTFSGYVGSYLQPPEPAEGVIWCPICQEETDAQFEWEEAWCFRDHEVTIDEPDEEVS